MPTSSGGSSSGGSGALTLLSTTTNASAVQMDVSGIAGTYNDLLLVLIARSAEASSNDVPTIRFNNDSGTNYYTERIFATAATPASAESVASASGVFLGRLPAASGLANSFGITQIYIPGYASTTWLKSIQFSNWAMHTATTGNLYTYTGGGLWNSTAAITRIQVLSGASAGLAIGSTLRIYGCL